MWKRFEICHVMLCYILNEQVTEENLMLQKLMLSKFSFEFNRYKNSCNTPRHSYIQFLTTTDIIQSVRSIQVLVHYVPKEMEFVLPKLFYIQESVDNNSVTSLFSSSPAVKLVGPITISVTFSSGLFAEVTNNTTKSYNPIGGKKVTVMFSYDFDMPIVSTEEGP